MPGLQTRVRRVADDVLARQGSVTFPEVLVGLGWVADVHVDAWRQGRVAHLQELVQVRPERLHEALQLLESWAAERRLLEQEVAPLARSRHRTELRFAAASDPSLERVVRVCWVRPDLPDRDQERLVERQNAAA